MIDPSFWQGKKVFLTGHTGFKGAWLSLWLHRLGAKVTGYSLQPPTKLNLFDLLKLDHFIHSIYGNIRDFEKLKSAVLAAKPDIVIHMAAQPLVRYSYQFPVETFEVNVMGTVNLLEAVRQSVAAGIPIKAVLNVTTDKCYENREWVWGYREQDSLGGYDPYSNSKACSELVTASYRNSFFHPDRYKDHGVSLSTARAGNVIGGGDWAIDRLIPDCVRNLLSGQPVQVRNPFAIRPWQHVLEPLNGYLLLAQKQVEFGIDFAESWNFGPYDHDVKPVEWIVKQMCNKWGTLASYELQPGDHPHEAGYLKLDCSKARLKLGWQPVWELDEALNRIVEWTKAYENGEDIREVCEIQIEMHQNCTAQI